MAVLARKVDKPPLWANASDPAIWRGNNFDHAVLQELSARGVSFWEVTSYLDRKLHRIAAALTIQRNEDLSSIQFRFLDITQAQALQLDIRTTRGNTADDEINDLHRDLVDITGPQAVELARIMARRRPMIISKSDLARDVVESVNEGHINPRPDFHKNFLRALWTTEHLALV